MYGEELYLIILGHVGFWNTSSEALSASSFPWLLVEIAVEVITLKGGGKFCWNDVLEKLLLVNMAVLIQLFLST